jgi:hypothetical protein
LKRRRGVRKIAKLIFEKPFHATFAYERVGAKADTLHALAHSGKKEGISIMNTLRMTRSNLATM